MILAAANISFRIAILPPHHDIFIYERYVLPLLRFGYEQMDVLRKNCGVYALLDASLERKYIIFCRHHIYGV